MLLQSAAGRGAICCPRPVVGVRPVKWLRSGPIVYANGEFIACAQHMRMHVAGRAIRMRSACAHTHATCCILSLVGNKQQRANIKQQLKVTSAPKLDEIAPVQAPQPQQPRAPGVVPVLQPQQQQQQPSIGRLVWRRLVRELSSLPRAISLMGIITALSALGTIIPQNKVRSRRPPQASSRLAAQGNSLMLLCCTSTNSNYSACCCASTSLPPSWPLEACGGSRTATT